MQAFIITGIQRTGSAAIARALGFHDGVACGWEWPQKVSWLRRVEACRRALSGDFTLLSPAHREQIAAQMSPATRWIGYRSLFRANDKWLWTPAAAPSLFLDRLRDNVAWWRGNAAIHFIHIVRTDHIAWLRSKFIARESGAYWAGQQYSQNISVNVPIGPALKRLRMKLWIDSELGRIRHHNSYCLVRYEDFMTDVSATAAAVQRFLGLEPQLMPEERMPERQSAGIPIERHIENYAQLHAALERADLLIAPAGR